MKKRFVSTARALAFLAVWGGISVAPVLAQSQDGGYTGGARRVPYQEFQTANCPQNDACRVLFAAVPQGKRLVLERVNAAILFANSGIRRTALFVAGKPYFLPVRTQQPDFAVVNESVLAFYAAGDAPFVAATFNDPSEAVVMEVTLTGFLVDAEP